MAYLFFGETLTLVQLVGMAVTAAGVWLATRHG
jgi:drug/metabolite transporter (DMT)-like permease